VTPEELSELVSRVEQMIDPATDAVHLLPTWAGCWSRLVVRGQVDVTPDRPHRAALRLLSVTVVAPFGGRLRKIDFTSRVQAHCLRKHGFPPCFQDRVLVLVGLACSGLPNVLVSDPSTGVGFRTTSRRRAYRNPSCKLRHSPACTGRCVPNHLTPKGV
jgi:hypothetical protein